MKRAFLLCLLMITSSAGIFAQTNLPVKPLQAVVVTTQDWSSVQGTARLFERKNGKRQVNPLPLLSVKTALRGAKDFRNFRLT